MAATSILGTLGDLGTSIARAKKLQRDEGIEETLLQDQLKNSALNRVLAQRDLALRTKQLDAQELTRQLAMQKYMFDMQQALEANRLKDPAVIRQRIEGALGRRMSDQEAQHLFKLSPNTATSPYTLHLDNKRQLVWIPKDPRSGLRSVPSGIYGPAPSAAFGTGEDLVASYAESVRRGDIKLPQVPQKIRGDVIRYMQSVRMTPGRARTPDEIKQLDAIRKVEPVVSRLTMFLEKNKLQGRNSVMDVVNQYRYWQLYSHGKKPPEPWATMIKNSAALRIMGAAPWVSLGRGRYLFAEIQKHLPNPEYDSPANLYDKMQFLRGILEDAKVSLSTGAQGEGPDQDNDLNNLPPP